METGQVQEPRFGLVKTLLGIRPSERVVTRPPGGHWGDEDVGRLEKEVRWLKVWRIGCLVAIVIAYGGTLVLALKPESLTLVVADSGGKVLYEGKAGDFSVPDLFIENRLKEWIDMVRRRSDDPVVNTLWRDKSKAMTTGESIALLEAYFAKVDDIEKQNAGNRWRVMTTFSGVNVKLSGTVQKLSRTEYRMIWSETWTPQYGQGSKTVVMDGTFKIKLREKTGPLGKFQITVQQHQAAPFGVYIEWFTWNAMSEGAS